MDTADQNRKHLLINPRFQVRMIATFVAISILMTASIFAFTYRSYHSFLTTLSEKKTEMSFYSDMVQQFLEKNVTVYWVPEEFKKELFKKLVIFTLLLAFFVILWGVFTSHRIAGPLYRLNRHMLDSSEGKTTEPLHFRTKDEFQDLADSFNKNMNHWNQKYDSLRKDKDQLAAEIQILVGKSSTQIPASELRAILVKHKWL